jgi:hypothetical protein
MNIINRIGKYKQPGRSWYQRKVNTIKYITVHHSADQATGTNDQILQKEANAHIANGWPGLSYHFFITKDGQVYQINNFSDVTWHDTVNWDSIGVCLQGYFHQPVNENPTDPQLRSLRALLDELCKNHPEFPADQSNVLGHKERSATSCPGDNLIGLVQDYRNKLGNVSWGGAIPLLTDAQKYQKIIAQVESPAYSDTGFRNLARRVRDNQA